MHANVSEQCMIAVDAVTAAASCLAVKQPEAVLCGSRESVILFPEIPAVKGTVGTVDRGAG
jgi:hypothetical protein